MSRHVSPDHKAAVLALLEANNGNVAQTARQTGFAERTLYSWKRHLKLSLQPQQKQQSLSLPPQVEDMHSEDTYALLYDYLMQAALKIAAELPGSVHSPDLLRRVSALNGLLDRLDFMDDNDPENPQTETLQIEFVDALGNISTTPPWAAEAEDEE